MQKTMLEDNKIRNKDHYKYLRMKITNDGLGREETAIVDSVKELMLYIN